MCISNEYFLNKNPDLSKAYLFNSWISENVNFPIDLVVGKPA